MTAPHPVDASGNDHGSHKPHGGSSGNHDNGGSAGKENNRKQRRRANQPAIRTFMAAVLNQLGAPVNKQTLGFMYAWARREGAGGAYNPLNTTLSMPGASSMNGVGVKNYTSWQQGAKATALTLANYGDIAGALRSGSITVNDHFNGLLTWSGHSYSSLSGIDTSPYVIYSGPAGSGQVDHLDGGAPAGQVNVTGNPGGGGGVPTQRLTHGQIAQGLNSMGFAASLIHSNKSLTQAFQHILHLQLKLDTAGGRARAQQILQDTAWFRNHTKAQREFDMLQASDPRQWQKAIHDTRQSLVAEAQQLGLPLDHDQLDHMATIVTRNGLTSDEINQLLAHHFNFQGGDAYTGQIGNAIDNIRQSAANYYVPAGHDLIQHLTRQVIAGQMDPTQVGEIFKEKALSMFPYLQQQLNAGQTVADIADPYKQLYSQYLEVDPGAIHQHDPLVMGALQSKDEQGNLGLMPLWQFQNKLMSDPRWLTTNNARQSLVSKTGQVLQKMGLIS